MQEQHQLAIWNPERDCWETGVEDIFGHSDVYSETWPTSGMTRNGVAYALPTWEPPTTASGCSSSPPAEMFRTPAAAEAEGGALSPERARVENRTLRLTGQILDMVAPDQMSDAWRALPTPRASDGTKGGPNQRGSAGDLMLPSAVHLLPTPTAQDSSASGGSNEHNVTLTDATVRTRMGTTPNPRHATPTGAPTPPPSTDGSPSWEDVPLPLPSSPNAENTDSPPVSRSS